MNREAFYLAGKIVTGTATERDRQRLANILQDEANSLKSTGRPNIHSNRLCRFSLDGDVTPDAVESVRRRAALSIDAEDWVVVDGYGQNYPASEDK